MANNTILLSLNDQTVAAILQHIAAIRALITQSASLTKESKAKLAKMGKKRLNWSKDAFEYAQQYPLLLSQYRNLQLWTQVKRDYEYMNMIMKPMGILNRLLLDLFTVIGADYYAFALDFYAAVQDSDNDDHPGIIFVLDELAKQFEGQGLKNEPDPSEDPFGTDSNATGSNGNASGTSGSPSDGGSAPV